MMIDVDITTGSSVVMMARSIGQARSVVAV